jgi:hypothetical protein
MGAKQEGRAAETTGMQRILLAPGSPVCAVGEIKKADRI